MNSKVGRKMALSALVLFWTNKGDNMCHINCVSRDNQSFYPAIKYIHQNNALLIKIKVYFRESIKNMIISNRYYFAFLETLPVLWNKIFFIKRCAFRSSTRTHKTYFRFSKKKCILHAITKKVPAKINSFCKNCIFCYNNFILKIQKTSFKTRKNLGL